MNRGMSSSSRDSIIGLAGLSTSYPSSHTTLLSPPPLAPQGYLKGFFKRQNGIFQWALPRYSTEQTRLLQQIRARGLLGPGERERANGDLGVGI